MKSQTRRHAIGLSIVVLAVAAIGIRMWPGSAMEEAAAAQPEVEGAGSLTRLVLDHLKPSGKEPVALGRVLDGFVESGAYSLHEVGEAVVDYAQLTFDCEDLRELLRWIERNQDARVPRDFVDRLQPILDESLYTGWFSFGQLAGTES